MIKNISSYLYSIIFFSLLFLVSCTNENLNPKEDHISDQDNTSQSAETEKINENSDVLQDCPGTEINTIGKGIADSYENINYQEVMVWFCNGSEFEDIFLALQTAEQTSTEAEELLVMLVDGFTWEEIWLVVGLIE